MPTASGQTLPAISSLGILIDQLPDGVITTDPAIIEGYRYDNARAPETGTPLAVARPTSTEQVQTIVRWAAEHLVPIVPRGAGTGLSGGSSAIDGGLTLSLDRMRAITIDPATRIAIVEPGALNAEVKSAAAEHGLWYPPDPASFEICSIGGNIATNAGGLCCVKYGVTTDYVMGLDVVTADGSLLTLGGPRLKDAAGLSLVKLFVGSEGTLGIITKAVLRLMPSQPLRSTLVATFASVEEAAETVVEIGKTLRPSMMELMDQACINAVEDFKPMGLDRTAGAMLLAQSDAAGEARSVEIAAMEQVCRQLGATEVFVTDDPEEGEMFAASRRAMFPALDARGALMLEDVGVPVPLLPQLLNGIKAIAERHRVEVPVCAHAGDGNTHPNIIYDPGDPDSKARASAAFTEIMDLAISLGGTITGEHGVGRLKRGSLADQLGPGAMALTTTIKQALDPLGIFNPGAILAAR